METHARNAFSFTLYSYISFTAAVVAKTYGLDLLTGTFALAALVTFGGTIVNARRMRRKIMLPIAEQSLHVRTQFRGYVEKHHPYLRARLTHFTDLLVNDLGFRRRIVDATDTTGKETYQLENAITSLVERLEQGRRAMLQYGYGDKRQDVSLDEHEVQSIALHTILDRPNDFLLVAEALMRMDDAFVKRAFDFVAIARILVNDDYARRGQQHDVDEHLLPEIHTWQSAF